MLGSFARYWLRYVVRCFPGSPFRRFRNWLWRRGGFNVHPTANLLPTAVLICNDITIGKETFVGEEAMITGGVITIGDRCDIAPRAIIHAGSHDVGDSDRRAGRTYAGEISIGDGTWIGTGATVLAGAKIGRGCLVAAGSLVTAGEYPENSLLAGVPAQCKKTLD